MGNNCNRPRDTNAQYQKPGAVLLAKQKLADVNDDQQQELNDTGEWTLPNNDSVLDTEENNDDQETSFASWKDLEAYFIPAQEDQRKQEYERKKYFLDYQKTKLF